MASTELEKSANPVTLRDVADHLGVKPMTVSRSLNGGSVSPKLRATVLAAVEELGYRPNLAARATRSKRSRQVGVLVRNNSRVHSTETLGHPLAYEFVLGISEGLEEAGYMMSFVRLSDIDPEKHVQASAFQGHLLDGVIVVNAVPAASAERMEELAPRCVWLDGSVWRPHGCVRRDEHHAGRAAARALAELGYREWLVLRHPENGDHFSSQLRLRGIHEAAREYGAQVREWSVPWKECGDFPGLWPQLHPQLGVIALDPYIISYFQHALLDSDLRAGRDFALVACDEGFNGSGVEWRHLARVTFDRFDLGRRAAQMMLSELETEQPGASIEVRGQWRDGRTARPCPN